MIRTAARDTDCTFVTLSELLIIQFLSAMSINLKVTFNSILTVLRHYIIILLTLEVSHNVIFLRVDIVIVVLIIQKNIVLYNKVCLNWGCKK